MNKTEDYIRRVLERNPDNASKYEYHLVDYTNAQNKVTVVCKRHGSWDVNANSHIRGTQCPLCCRNTKKTKESVIKQAKDTHNGLYNYPDFEYVNVFQKISIHCEQHGLFTQTIHNHLQGQGCPKCSCRFKYTTEDFIAKAKTVHGDLYSYERSVFVDSKQKMLITCKIHSDFLQSSSDHIQGRGCPTCRKNTSKGSLSIRSVIKRLHNYEGINSNLYFIEINTPTGVVYKIGKGVNPEARAKRIAKESGYDCKLLYETPSDVTTVLLTEQYLHDCLSDKRADVKGFGGYTECFSLESELLDEAVIYAEHLLTQKQYLIDHYQGLYGSKNTEEIYNGR
jgi:hypothetical protein